MQLKKNDRKYYLFEIDILVLNIVCVLILLFLGLITYFIWPSFWNQVFAKVNIVFFVILYILYMGVHEILHSIGYVLYGGNFKKIVYGMQLESGIFYCLCKQNVNRKNILNSLLFPLFYLGVLTYILSLIFNSYYLLLLSIFNIAGCAGDIMMFVYMIKLNKDIEYTEFDNAIQFAVYANYDVSKYSHFGLKYKGCVSSVCRNDLKKIKVSKFSYIICILILLWCLIFSMLPK